MSVGIVVLLVVAAILLFKVACNVLVTEEQECDGNCGCEGNCGKNCKCKDK